MNELEYIRALNDLRVARDVEDTKWLYWTLHRLSVHADDDQWAPILEWTDAEAADAQA